VLEEWRVRRLNLNYLLIFMLFAILFYFFAANPLLVLATAALTIVPLFTHRKQFEIAQPAELESGVRLRLPC
jgi:hypothetical protein